MDIGTTVDSSIRHWWVFLIRGILFIAVAIYMICVPVVSFIALGFIFGLIIFLAGIAELLHVYHANSAHNRGWHLMLGIIDIILGIVLMGHVAAGITILRLIIGIWFLLKGVSLFAFSGLMRKQWGMAIGGFLLMILAMAILFNAAFGAMTIILWTAIAFIIAGTFNLVQAYWMKRAR